MAADHASASLGERLRAEVREMLSLTFYFFLCFSFFLTLRHLMLAEHDIKAPVLGGAVLSALIAGKVALLLGKTSIGDLERAVPPWVAVVYRSAIYTIAVLLASAGERLFHFYRETGTLAAAWGELVSGRDAAHTMALGLCVAASFLFFNILDVLDERMGPGALRRILTTRPEG